MRRLRCVHFTGIQNDACDVGVKYDSVRNDDLPAFKGRFPCMSEVGSCSLRRFPTAEETAAEEAMWAKVLADTNTARKAIVAVTEGKRRVAGKTACPVCDGGTLAYSVAGNGHIHAACSTESCVRWME